MNNTLYHTCIYNRLFEDEPSVSKHEEDKKNRLSEDEPSVSKHEEDIKKFKN